MSRTSVRSDATPEKILISHSSHILTLYYWTTKNKYSSNWRANIHNIIAIEACMLTDTSVFIAEHSILSTELHKALHETLGKANQYNWLVRFEILLGAWDNKLSTYWEGIVSDERACDMRRCIFDQLVNSFHGTVEPRYNEVPRDWENVFVISRVRYKRNPVITNLWENDQNFVISGYG